MSLFNAQTFRQDLKQRVSVVNLSLEYDNIRSTIAKVCAEMEDRLGDLTFRQIAAVESGDADLVLRTAKDYLQRVVLHFALYEHVIYTIANIGNDGITVTKSDDRTTIYKYQQDQLEEKLLQDAWFWLNRLVRLLNTHPDTFTYWHSSDNKKELNALPVTKEDFERYVGVSDETFLLYAGWIVREVIREEVLSRFRETGDMQQLLEQHPSVVCAICYDTMARAAQRLAFHALPSPIRIDINNEMGKNHAQQADTTVREKVSRIFADKAFSMWQQADAELRRLQEEQAADYPQPRKIREQDKFVM